MNRQQQNHRLRMDSCLSHWGRGLNAPTSEILLFLKHNNCLAGMEKTDFFVIDIQIPACLKKKMFQFVLSSY